MTKSEQKGVIVKVAPVSMVTRNEGLGTVQEKEDLWDKLGPVDAMLHSTVSLSIGRDGNKGQSGIPVESLDRLDGLWVPKAVSMASESDCESIGEGFR